MDKQQAMLCWLGGQSLGTPDIIANDDMVRAPTAAVISARVDYTSGAIGEAHVEAFESLDYLDRGGFVLRARIVDHASSCMPSIRKCDGGFELSLAGDAEATAMLLALEQVIAALKPRLRQPESITSESIKHYR